MERRTKKQSISLCWSIWHSSRCPVCVLSSYLTVQLSYSKASHIALRIGFQHFLALPPTSSYSLCLLTPCCHLSSSVCDSPTLLTQEKVSACMSVFTSHCYSFSSPVHLSKEYTFLKVGVQECLIQLTLLSAHHALTYSTPVHPLSLNSTINPSNNI